MKNPSDVKCILLLVSDCPLTSGLRRALQFRMLLMTNVDQCNEIVMSMGYKCTQVFHRQFKETRNHASPRRLSSI